MLRWRALSVAVFCVVVAVLQACDTSDAGPVSNGKRGVRRVVYVSAVEKDAEYGKANFRKFVEAVRRTPGIDLARISLELINAIGPGEEPVLHAVAELSRRPPDVIVASSQWCLDAVLRTSMQVPVLFLAHPDPVELGIVKSLSAPGVNRTGFTYFSPVTAKHLETLHDAFPSVRLVGIIVDDYLMDAKWFTDDLRVAEAALGLDLYLFRATEVPMLRKTLASADAKRMQAWYVPISDIMNEDFDVVVDALHALHKPIVYSRIRAVAEGGTLAYEARLADPFGIWARQLRLILAGVPAAAIPIEQPQTFEIAVNLEGSDRYPALRPSKAILKRATRIYGVP